MPRTGGDDDGGPSPPRHSRNRVGGAARLRGDGRGVAVARGPPSQPGHERDVAGGKAMMTGPAGDVVPARAVRVVPASEWDALAAGLGGGDTYTLATYHDASALLE